jgi:predicted MFS family arabinose efflux permease
MRREIADGLRFLLSDPVLRSLAATTITVDLAFRLIGTIFLLYTARDLGFEAGILGMIFAVGGISSLLGAVIAPLISPRLGIGRAMIVGLALVGVALLLPPLAPAASVVGALLLITQQLVGDGAYTVWEINQTTLIQRTAPADALGRVNAGIRFGSGVAVLLGALLSGALGETIGLRATLLLGACTLFAAAALLLLSPVRSIHNAPPALRAQ